MVLFGDVALLVMLAFTAVMIIRMTNLFAAAMLSGIYSLLSAGLFVVMDAVDVAFTEAAVGAGISTVLMLGTLALVGHEEKKPKHRPLLPLVAVGLTGGLLVYGTLDMPPFGSPDNPIHHHVADHYLERSYEEMGGIPNVVTSVLAAYRGYDTMGETTVIFTAVVGVLLLLARGPRPERGLSVGERMPPPMHDRVILRLGTKAMVPFIMVFALYVQFHGDYGPGGGFQAGVIFAAAFVLYALVFGIDRATRVLPHRIAYLLAALGVMIYAGTGYVTMALGGEFLDYSVLAHDPAHGQHYGILFVELGVLTTVFGVMVSVFYAFAERGRARL